MAEMCRFFFLKQKTAYEMRISDWSSDVCSSDLSHLVGGERHELHELLGAQVLDHLDEHQPAERGRSDSRQGVERVAAVDLQAARASPGHGLDVGRSEERRGGKEGGHT